MKRIVLLFMCLPLFACESPTPAPLVGPSPASVATPAATLAPTTVPATAPPGPTTIPTLPPTTIASGLDAIYRELPAPPITLVADPNDGRSLYALLATDGLYKTSDGGGTWKHLPLPVAEKPFTPPPNPAYRNSVFIVPQQDVRITAGPSSRLYVRAAGTLLRSDDRGTTWQTLQTQIEMWTIDEHNGDMLYAWGKSSPAQRGLYRSHDGGTSWQRAYAGYYPPMFQSETLTPNHEGISALVVDPVAPGVLYAGTDFGVFRSSDQGQSWTEFNSGMPLTHRAYRWTPILLATTDSVYAASTVSPDGASEQAIILRLQVSAGNSHWAMLDGKVTARFTQVFASIHTLVANPAQPNSLYLGTDSGLFISADAGMTWQPVDVPDAHDIYRIAVAPGPQTKLYLWTEKGLLTVAGFVGSGPVSLGAPRPLDSKRHTHFRAWSPDGRRILYSLTEVTYQLRPPGWNTILNDLWVMNIDGTGRRQVAQRVFQTTWAPDGRRVAYSTPAQQAGTRANIIILDLGNGAKRSIARGELSPYVQGPVWLPDGRIAFQREGRLFAVHQDGTAESALNDIVLPKWSETAPVTGNYAISPDARRLAIWKPAQVQGHLWLANLDGSQLTQVVAPPDLLRPLGTPEYAQGVWSPDSQNIAFTINYHNGTGNSSDLWQSRTDGSGVRPLVRGDRRPEETMDSPTWSPDARYIVYADGQYLLNNELWAVDVVGGANWSLWHSDNLLTIGLMIWSPDGKYLAYQGRLPNWRDYMVDSFIAPVSIRTSDGH